MTISHSICIKSDVHGGIGAQCWCKVTIFYSICIQGDVHGGIGAQLGCKVTISILFALKVTLIWVLGLNMGVE